jgi:hypothetical protein
MRQTEYQVLDENGSRFKRQKTENTKEVIHEQSKKQRNELWAVDCQLAIRRKNEARRKSLQHRTRANNVLYRKIRDEGNRVVQKKMDE